MCIYLFFIRNLTLLRNGKFVSDLRVDLRYLPISKPTKRADGTIEAALESSKLYIIHFYGTN